MDLLVQIAYKEKAVTVSCALSHAALIQWLRARLEAQWKNFSKFDQPPHEKWKLVCIHSDCILLQRLVASLFFKSEFQADWD